MPRALRIWDLPTRLFHWALVVCVTGAFVSVKLGGLYMDWHMRFGLATLGLILFRLIWGILGPRYARFTQFVRGPRAVAAYLRGALPTAGHNPLGALSVIAMLAAIGFQAVSGLFISDDIMVEGPLYGRLDGSLTSTLAGLHRANEVVILALIGLHVVALAWYGLFRRKPLVPAMITGDLDVRHAPADALPARDDLAVWLRALVIAVCCTAFVLWIQSLAPSFY